MRSSITLLLFVLVLQACDNNPYGKGMTVYNQHCAVCHADDGNGLHGLIPPIRQSDYLKHHQDDLACLIRHGEDKPLTVNGILYDMQKMPANDILNPIAITNLINFINNAWGNKADFKSLEQVKKELEACE